MHPAVPLEAMDFVDKYDGFPCSAEAALRFGHDNLDFLDADSTAL